MFGARTRRVIVGAALFVAACERPRAPALPEPQVYEVPPVIVGEWRGEVASIAGRLDVTPLGRDRYRGVFEASERSMLYVLNMVHVRAPGRDGVPAPSNLVRFDWQDGRGDRGAGWLLVNEDNSVLTGSFGRGEGNTEGVGEWTMVREVESDDVGPLDEGDENDVGSTT